MGATAAVLGAAFLGFSAVDAHENARRAANQAKDEAAKQREALASLQAEPTPVIPIADETAKAARRRSIVDQMRRRGRASTILTDTSAAPSDALGG